MSISLLIFSLLFLSILGQDDIKIGFYYDPSDSEQALLANFLHVTAKHVNGGQRDATKDKLNYSGYAQGSSVELIAVDSEDLCLLVPSLQYILSVVSSPSHVESLQNAAEQSGIPVFHIGTKPSTYEDSSFLTVLHPAAVVAQALKDTLNHWHIERVAVLSDSASSVLSKAVVDSLNVSVHSTQASQLLSEARAANIKDIVIASNVAAAENFFQQINQSDFNFFFITTDTTPFQCVECQYAKLLWYRPHPSVRIQDKLVGMKQLIDFYIQRLDFLSMERQVVEGLLAEIANWCHFDRRTIVYSCASKPVGMSLLSAIVNKYYQFDKPSTFGSMKNTGNNFYQDLNVRVVKFQAEPGNRRLRKIGTWKKSEQYTELYPKEIDTLNDLSDIIAVTALNSIFTIFANSTAIQQRPNFNYKPDAMVPDRFHHGFLIDFLEKLRVSDSLLAANNDAAKNGNFKSLIDEPGDFTYSLYTSPDGFWGSQDYRNEWNGMIQELITGEADIILGALSISPERANYIDYTVPYYDLVGLQAVMKVEPTETELFRFLLVLEPEVWGIIIGAYFITSLLLSIFERLSPYSFTNSEGEENVDRDVNELRLTRKFTPMESMWFCLTSLTPQGGGEAPKNISGRLVAATWWLFGFIITASYTANLAAYLTVVEQEKSVDSLDELSEQYRIQFAPGLGQISEIYFKRIRDVEELFYNTWLQQSTNISMSPIERAHAAVWEYPISEKYKKMWKTMQDNGLPLSDEAGIQRVLDSGVGSIPKFAYIADATAVKYASTITHCNLRAVGNEFSKKAYAIGVQKGSKLKKQLDMG